jgi:hypothetical protein
VIDNICILEIAMSKIMKENWDNISDSSENVLNTRNYTYRFYHSVGDTKIYLGREKTTNCKCMMFMARKDLVEEKELPATEGLEVRVDFFRNDENKIGVVFKLLKEDFADVFYALNNDIMESIKDQTDEKLFLETFFNRLGVWKLFLKNAGKKGLGPERRRGLFGELHFVKNVLLPVFGNDGIKHWVGPQPAIHDIEVGEYAVEIKTSASKKSQSIHISGEKQLDDEGYEKLFLYQLNIDVRNSYHPNLLDTINEIKEILKNDNLTLISFNNLLLQSGYCEIHNDLYMSEGYHVEEINWFEVKEGFPRILGANIMDGIGKLKYAVDVSACTDYKVDEEYFKTFVEQLKK